MGGCAHTLYISHHIISRGEVRKATIFLDVSMFCRGYTGDGSPNQSTKLLRPLGGIDQLTEQHRTSCGQTCFTSNTFHHPGQRDN